MVNRTRTTYALAAALAFVALAPRSHAQLGALGFIPGVGGSVTVLLPAGSLRDRYKVGFGGGLVLEPAVPGPISASGELSVSRLLGQTREVGGVEERTGDISVWEFSGGVRYRLGASPWFVGVDGAYYVFSVNGSNGLDDEGGILPAIGFRTNGIGLIARYKLLGDVHWAQLRLTFR